MSFSQLAFYSYRERGLWITCPHCHGQVDVDLDQDLTPSRGAYSPTAATRCPHCGCDLALELEWVHQVVRVMGRAHRPAGGS